MMEKYGVVTGTEPEKTAEANDNTKCPRCGARISVYSGVEVCPNCGTLPFEQKETKESPDADPPRHR